VTTSARVLYATKLYHPWPGGVEKVVQWHAEGLRPEFETSVLACRPRGLGRRDEVNGVGVRRVPSLGMYKGMPVAPSYPLEFWRAARRADIVHAHLPFPIADMSASMFARGDVELIATWHSDLVRQRAVMPVYGPFMRRFLDRAARIIVPSEAALERSRDLRAYEGKCEVVPLGVPIPEKLDERKPESSGPVILYAGRLAYYKGLGHLLRAMRDVDAELVIAGTGELEAQLRAMAEELGVAGRVKFTGHVTDEELAGLYRRCDVFVLPSDSPAETTGLVQIEAMARGKPVVNTSLPTDVPRVSVDGETGLTVTPGSSDELAIALNALLGSAAMRERFGRAARERAVRHYSVEAMNSRVGDIYRQVLGTAAPIERSANTMAAA